jgi:hypothetical protein
MTTLTKVVSVDMTKEEILYILRIVNEIPDFEEYHGLTRLVTTRDDYKAFRRAEKKLRKAL